MQGPGFHPEHKENKHANVRSEPVRSRCGSSPKMAPGTAAKSHDLHLTSSYTLIKPHPMGELRRCTMMQDRTI